MSSKRCTRYNNELNCNISGKSLASHRGGPGSRPGMHVGFVVDKAALGQVFSEYFVFSCRS
jgi:hypothetical protein